MKRAGVATLRIGTWLIGSMLALVAAHASAGVNQWTSHGPYGGQVSVLVVDPRAPNTMYAAGSSSVFKTTDGALTWSRAGNGITDPTVGAIAIDPVTTSTLYAGSIQGGRMIKSTDGGATWNALAAGPTLVIALAIPAQAPSTIYAARQQAGLQKSTDGGATWAPVGVATLPSFPTIRSLVVDPANPNVVYAGEQSKGVFKSVDGGVTWAASNTGFTTGSVIQVVRLAIDPTNTATLYAAANTSSGAGLYKSTNAGASWTQVFPDNSSVIGVQAILVDPTNPANVYIGTFGQGAMKSTNGGTTFAKINTGLPQVGVNVLALNPASPGNLYAGTQNGVFASTNAGASWTTASVGLALTTVTAVAVDPNVPSTIYAATSLSGLFKSVDGGDSWTAINVGIGPTGNLACNMPNYSALAIDPLSPNRIYAGTQCTLATQIYLSTNGGANWEPRASGLPSFSNITGLVADALSPTDVMVGTNSGLYRTQDGGMLWSIALPSVRITAMTAVVLGQEAARAVGPAAGQRSSGVIAIKQDAAGKYTTIWIPFNGDYPVQDVLPTDADEDCIVNTIRGALWLGLTASAAEVFVACFSPAAKVIDDQQVLVNGQTVIVDLMRSSVQARDAAPAQRTYWRPPNNSSAMAAACAPINAIVDDVLVAHTFYAGGACGVLKGTNDGRQVVTMNDGLPPNTRVLALGTASGGLDLYAGAQSGGVWRYTTAATPGAPVPVVEFYNAALDHYFVTWVTDEIAKLDAGTVIKGWTRTGQSFKTYTAAQAGTSPVCRYYIPPGLGDSHFFGRGTTECNATGQKNPSFVLESPDFMQMFLPAAGVCPANTTNIYRVFSNRPDANHRYMTDNAIRNQMAAKGWLVEGDGPDAVVMCAPM